jgi:hypothetical protein
LSYGSVTRASHSSRAAIEVPFVQSWFPSQRQKMLLGTSTDTAVHGVVIDTKAMEPRLPKDNILKIRKDMMIVLRRSDLSIRKLAAIAGRLQSTPTAVFPSRHHTWQLVSQVHEGLNDPRNLHHSSNWTVTDPKRGDIDELPESCLYRYSTQGMANSTNLRKVNRLSSPPPPKYYEAVDNLSEMGQIALKALEKIYLQKTLDLKRGARFEREFLLL